MTEAEVVDYSVRVDDLEKYIPFWSRNFSPPGTNTGSVLLQQPTPEGLCQTVQAKRLQPTGQRSATAVKRKTLNFEQRGFLHEQLHFIFILCFSLLFKIVVLLLRSRYLVNHGV